MHGHPSQEVKGAKAPKPENAKSRLSSRPGPRIAQLSEEYLEIRNRAQAAKAFMAETQAAKQRGELISRKLVDMQAAYLLTTFRQRCLLEPATIAHQLASLALIDAAKEHDISEVIRERIYALLTDLSNLPAQVTDPNWLEKIDGDLLNQVEGDGESGGRVTDPSGIRRKDEQSKRRREKKTETMRRLRAEGRVKG